MKGTSTVTMKIFFILLSLLASAAAFTSGAGPRLLSNRFLLQNRHMKGRERASFNDSPLLMSKKNEGDSDIDVDGTESGQGVTEDEWPDTTMEITSKEIVRLEKKIEDLKSQIESVKNDKRTEEALLAKMEEEFGGEIARIKKEFARMKERSFEEATDIANKAKVDALKEVLPITDNYFRAKKVFEPLGTEGEQAIQGLYDKIFADFTKVIADFGVVRVQSIGQPFDFNFMEAIMTAPSTEYAADVVCTEYQVGYKIGEKCIRPAMVVVSTGPGPTK